MATNEQQLARSDYETASTETSDRLRYQHEFSLAALKTLTLANGGGVLALFTFVGNSNAHFDRTAIWTAFALFAGGLFATMAHI